MSPFSIGLFRNEVADSLATRARVCDSPMVILNRVVAARLLHREIVGSYVFVIPRIRLVKNVSFIFSRERHLTFRRCTRSSSARRLSIYNLRGRASTKHTPANKCALSFLLHG